MRANAGEHRVGRVSGVMVAIGLEKATFPSSGIAIDRIVPVAEKASVRRSARCAQVAERCVMPRPCTEETKRELVSVMRFYLDS